MKIFFRRIHLYLGLAAGIVITITCLTGAILVFEEELQHLCFRERYYVAEGNARVGIADITKNLQQAVPGAKVNSVRVFTDPRRTVEISYKPKKKEGAEKKKPEQPRAGGENNFKAYADPYTGKIIASYNTRATFFYKVMAFHRWLLADDPGKLIVGTSTAIFLFIIITGIILWWPANKKILKQRLKIKSNAGWKRTNHDWHIVLGFYTSILLFVFAFTGLAWSFKWFNNGIYYVTGSPLKNPEPPRSVVADTTAKKLGYDKVLATIQATQADVVYYNINAPKGDSDVYNVTVLTKTAAHETATDMYYVDAYSGNVSGKLLFSEKSTGARVRSTFKPVHTGAIFGWTSKIIACIVCLAGTTLPVTGILMWINRTFKKRSRVV